MIGQKLGSFRIEAELGSGAMGVVYGGSRRARTARWRSRSSRPSRSARARHSSGSIREAKILEQFRHPNIVRYIARGKSGGTYYYAMEYVSGPTLDKVLRDRGVIPWRKVAAIGVQLCEALQYAHDHGVIHRDLKPSNLMVNEKGQLKLTDFGIAKDLDRTALTGTGRTLGTAAYMAPEQIRGTPEISHKTDLYSLGAVLYQMLTGDPPFTGPSARRHDARAHQRAAPAAQRQGRGDPQGPRRPGRHPDGQVAHRPPLGRRRPSARSSATSWRRPRRKETITMVWPEPGTAASMPTRAEILTDDVGPRTARPRRRRRRQGFRLSLETVGLVAALVAVAGVIGYLVWPPGPDYLYKQGRGPDGLGRPAGLDPGPRGIPRPARPAIPRTPLQGEDRGLARPDRPPRRRAAGRGPREAQPRRLQQAQGRGRGPLRHTFKEADAALKLHHDQDAERSGGRWQATDQRRPREPGLGPPGQGQGRRARPRSSADARPSPASWPRRPCPTVAHEQAWNTRATSSAISSSASTTIPTSPTSSPRPGPSSPRWKATSPPRPRPRPRIRPGGPDPALTRQLEGRTIGRSIGVEKGDCRSSFRHLVAATSLAEFRRRNDSGRSAATTARHGRSLATDRAVEPCSQARDIIERPSPAHRGARRPSSVHADRRNRSRIPPDRIIPHFPQIPLNSHISKPS